MNAAAIALLTQCWVAAWSAAASHKAWKDWRGTVAKLPALKTGSSVPSAERCSGSWLCLSR
jgi:hypothetical protein